MRETLHDIAPYLAGNEWRKRTELRPAIHDQLHAAALETLSKAASPTEARK